MDDETIKFINSVPKIELHCHLEGTVTPEILHELAIRNEPDSLFASSLEACEEVYNFTDFSSFLKSFSQMYDYIRTPTDIKLITERALSSMDSHQYIEFLFSADRLIKRGYSFPELFDALKSAIRSNCEVGVIIDFVRNYGPSPALQLLEDLSDCLEDYKTMVLGIGIGGDEINFPAKLFKDVFDKARKLGLHTTVHAGEALGPESIWDSIFTLKTERIGHGFSAIQSPDLIRHLRATQTHIECNPTSNIVTGLVKNKEMINHPFGIFHSQGLNTSINTDDPGFFKTSITNEYLAITQAFNLTRQDLEDILLNTARSSFQPYYKQLELTNKLRTFFDSF
ncbi:MAG: adenosine deaminase [Candidatus Hodarchaeales archaeon]